MGLLLDTHIILAVVERKTLKLTKPMVAALEDPEMPCWVSTASVWELAIKSRAGKLPLTLSIDLWPEALHGLGFGVLPIYPHQVFAEFGAEPSTKDPFDRLLLGVCAAEGLRLVTIDRHLSDHPLAWRPT